MERREALKSVALLMGTAISATTFSAIFSSCNPTDKTAADLFSEEQEKTLAEIADTIIPTTDSPGAKAAGVGPFITMMIAECYPEDTQKVFVKGLEDLEKRSEKDFAKPVLQLSPEQRTKLLESLRQETIKLQEEEKKRVEAELAKNKDFKPETDTVYFFAIVRDLTLLGYFSSEIGTTKARAYVPVPGRYDGCVDLKPGQKVWS